MSKVPVASSVIHKGEDWSEIFQRGQNPVAIVSSTNASPIVLTTSKPHGYVDGDKVRVYGHSVNTTANGNFTVASATTSTFALTGSTGNGVGSSTGYVAKCIDGTGGTVRCQFRENVSDSALLTQQPTITWLDQTILRFKLSLSDTLTAAIDVDVIQFDIFFDDSAGVSTKILQGEIRVIASTTRA